MKKWLKKLLDQRFRYETNSDPHYITLPWQRYTPTAVGTRWWQIAWGVTWFKWSIGLDIECDLHGTEVDWSFAVSFGPLAVGLFHYNIKKL
jgi:hypothetical protein